MALNAESAYLQSELDRASPVELITMLYRGALSASVKARAYLEQGDAMARSREISRAMAIINELALSLDHERGGEVARNLVELYDYMQTLLQTANFLQQAGPLLEFEQLAGTLLGAWEQCSAQLPPPRLEQPVYADTGAELSATYSPRSFTY